MAEQDESLVMRRPKRSTAGNRMEAALAEFRAEELGQDGDEDNDFTMEIDEQDTFGSDFESTDEEGAQEDVDAAAERMVVDEEKKIKKAARSQLDKVTAAAHARNKATFNPQIAETSAPKTPAVSKPKRRVSMGVVVDAETGEVMESGKRHSLRRNTLMATSISEIRARDEQEKKSAVPKKVKTKTRAPAQAELIARALDMEEGNIKEHRNYLTDEEEKRKKARLVRATVEGPLLRWVTKAEHIKVKTEPPPAPVPPPAPIPPPTLPIVPVSQYAYHFPPYSAPSTAPAIYSTPFPNAPRPVTSFYHSPQTSGFPPSYSSQNPYGYNYYTPPPPLQSSSACPSQPPAFVAAAPPLPPPEPIEVTQTVSKCYVVHENSQEEDATKPLWKDTMAAMFGDHVKWEDLKVYTGKGRPISRPDQKCPITGQIARYRDPRTGVPFANARAFDVLTKVLAHEYVWSDALGCYTAHQDQISQTETVESPLKRTRQQGRAASISEGLQ